MLKSSLCGEERVVLGALGDTGTNWALRGNVYSCVAIQNDRNTTGEKQESPAGEQRRNSFVGFEEIKEDFKQKVKF